MTGSRGWLLLALFTLTLIGTRAWTRTTPVPEIVNRPIEQDRNGYVGSGTCRACHQGNYASWYGSYHRRMTQAASDDAIVAELDGTKLVWEDHRYHLGRDDDGFWVEMDRGVGTPRTRRPIVMTTGSHHRQWLWFATGDGRKIGAIPFIYLIHEDRWIPRHAAFMQPPNPEWRPTPQEGLWGVGCISCHTTHGEMRGEHEARVTEFGISCEACHGPGEEHVRVNQDPRRRYGLHWNGESDPTIVNPKTLPHPQSSEVCGQCHSVLAAREAFRPGDDLAVVLAGKSRDPLPEASRWPDGMMRTGGREYDALQGTPCFRKGEMSCFSCHSMHQQQEDARPMSEWAADQLSVDMGSDRACLQCHDDLEEDHSHHKPESSGSRCYNCHMPHTSYALLKAIRNHGVNPPTVTESIEAGRPNACNVCHLDRSLGWTADHLAKWYDTPRPELTEDQERVAASVLWAVSGHAGQRALIAWHMGWEPAREISGSGWLAPYLTLLMNDPYPSVRIIAYRSMKQVEGFEGFAFDDVGPEEAREAALREAVEIWRTKLAGKTKTGDALLIGPDGALMEGEFTRLAGARDHTTIHWIE